MDSAKNSVRYDDDWEWPPAEKATKTVVGSSRPKKKKKEPLREITIADLEQMIVKFKKHEIEQDKLIYNLELKVNRLMEKL